ncbi:MAG: T9SS type A sorting domain-containing protein [Chitinophagaceae bacterium]|nr:T9SS type A sorting domain-containing protein [Chitinophagaceae bacterium]
MKKLIAVILPLALSIQLNAQGVNQLWGLSRGDDPLIRGHLFSWDSATNTITNRKTFFGSIFNYPYPNFTVHNGMIYGVTGGDSYATQSSIFEWDLQTPEAPGVVKAVVNGISNGSLVSWNDKLYGLTRTGGAADSGFIFEWDPASGPADSGVPFGWDMTFFTTTEKISFDFTKGSQPLGGLVLLNDKLYGMTAKGGDYDLGVIFEWDPATNDFNKKFDFDGTNGASPNGNLTWSGSLFYGVTDSGGVNNEGVLFSWDPVTNSYNKKLDFVAADGENPCGTLVATGNKLYGMTTNGGANDLGVIFRWNTDSEVFSKLTDLNSTVGGNPKGSMTLYNTRLYANTTLGMIEYDTVANTCLKKYDTQGNDPFNQPALFNGKLYSTIGSLYGSSGVMEIDIATGTTKNYLTLDENYLGGGYGDPNGLAEREGKLYGLTEDGGAARVGMIFRYNPSDYVQPYQPRYFFNRGEDGAYPYGNAFGGITSWGGWFDQGTAWGYNPGNNTVGVSRHFDSMTDPPPSGNPTPWGIMQNGKLIEDMQNGEWVEHFNLGPGTGEPDLFGFNDKVYGVTDGGGGANNMGYIFEWDPDEWSEAPQRFFNKLDFNGANGASPNGTFTLLNGKFYGITRLGGANNMGTLYEWDPATNILTTLAHFDGTDKITSPFTAMNGKLYGMRGGGVNNKGMIFEVDPATGQVTNKATFDGVTNGKNSGDRLLVVPAGIARSAPGSCVGFPSVTIDATNNNIWVPIVDSRGDVLAEVKANGNNLGLLSIQSYVNAGPVRQDGEGRLYLDRNITITPAEQPAEGNPVDVRFYIPQSEFDALLNTGNAAINDINDVAVFKGAENCDNNVHHAIPLPTTAENYAHGYVLSASISSFSSFYFASRTFEALPLQLLSFSGVVTNNDAQLKWETSHEQNVAGFDIERSTDKSNFVKAGTATASNTPGNHNYAFTDAGIYSLGVSTVYYRIKLKDNDGRFTYSSTIALQLNTSVTSVQFYPNPVSSRANLVITADKSQQVQWRILDNTGKAVGKNTARVSKGVISLPVEVGNLPKGVYYLDVKGAHFSKMVKFVKQ